VKLASEVRRKRSSRGRGLALELLFVALACESRANAQPLPVEGQAPEQVQLEYSSEPGCPSQAVFIEQVTARIRRPVGWTATDGGTHIILSLTQKDGGATGRLEVARNGTPPTRREFTAATCGEVGSALALVVALALDPNARTEAIPPATPPPASTSPQEQPAVAPAPAASPPPPAAPPSAAPAARPAHRPPAVAPLRYAAWFGPVAGAHTGYAPETLVTFGLSLGARFSWGSWFSPTLQLSPLWGKTGVTGPAADLSSFAWSMARLEACPVDVRLTPTLGLSPCFTGELGRLKARGNAEDVAPTTVDRWWVAPGVAAALHLQVGSWYLRLSGEGVFPAVRDEFVFSNPERSVHRPSAFVYGARLGLGFQLGS
jgi:hypothetical protein